MPRKTEQRDAIRDVIEHAERPLNAQEILARAQVAVPRMGIATVYRNLKAMVEDGSLATVELPHEASRSERSDLGHHHHSPCTSCPRVFDIDGCAGHVDELAPEGFAVEHHEIMLYGRCPECSKSE